MVDRLRLCLRGTRFSEPPPDINGSALADHGSMFSFLSGEQFLKATMRRIFGRAGRSRLWPLRNGRRPSTASRRTLGPRVATAVVGTAAADTTALEDAAAAVALAWTIRNGRAALRRCFR